MNGPQDLGGRHGFGAVLPEGDGEPLFHAPWERDAFALTLAAGALGQWNIDAARHARESLPWPRYLQSSYYQIWIAGLERLLLDARLVDADELRSGTAATPGRQVTPLTAARVDAVLDAGTPYERAPNAPAHFAVGDRVVTIVANPSGHTRLPAYARGRPGRIHAVHGVHVFPDTHARGAGEQPTWLYSVRFDAIDLFGADTTADAVYVDCFEPYLRADPTATAAA